MIFLFQICNNFFSNVIVILYFYAILGINYIFFTSIERLKSAELKFSILISCFQGYLKVIVRRSTMNACIEKYNYLLICLGELWLSP